MPTTTDRERTHRRHHRIHDRSTSERRDPDPIAALHKAVGNRVVGTAVEAEPQGTDLRVSEPGDPAEREAERVAEAVVAPSENESTSPPVDGGGSHTAPSGKAGHRADGVLQSTGIRGTGRPLPGEIRSFFESRFGHDLGGIRVHTGSDADRAARSIDARAFTVGQDIAFRSGAFDPSSESGRRLLAHELVHTIQNSSRPRRSHTGSTLDRLKSSTVYRQAGAAASGTTATPTAASLIAEHTGRLGTLDERGLAADLLDEYVLAGSPGMLDAVFSELQSDAQYSGSDINQISRAIFDLATMSEIETIVRLVSSSTRRLLNRGQTAAGEPTYYPEQTGDAARNRSHAELQSMEGVSKHVVEPGDTLSTLAETYGVPGGWRTIWETNRKTIGSDPNLIYPDQVLYLPRTTAAAARLEQRSQRERMEQLEELAGQ